MVGYRSLENGVQPFCVVHHLDASILCASLVIQIDTFLQNNFCGHKLS